MATFPQYQIFYRTHGIKRGTTLLDPYIATVKVLPVNSRVHILGSQDEPQIDTSNPWYAAYPDRVRLNYVGAYGETPQSDARPTMSIVGSGRFTPSPLANLGAKFCIDNKKFQYIRDPSKILLSQLQLMVYNYGYLDKVYRYPQTRITGYERYINKLLTVWTTIRDANERSSVNNIVILDVPKAMVSRTTLMSQSLVKPAQLVQFFDTEEKLFIREIWLWLDEKTRDKSTLSVMSEKDLASTTVMFKLYNGQYAVLNLGYLYSWVKGNNNLTPMSSLATVKSTELQKYFLKFLMTLQSFNATGTMSDLEDMQEDKTTVTSDSSEVDDELQSVEGGTDQDDEGVRFQENSPLLNTSLKKSYETSEYTSIDAVKDINDLEPEINIDKQLADMEADLAALDQIEDRRLNAKFAMNLKANKNKPADDGMSEISEVEVNTYDSDITESVEEITAELFNNPTVQQIITRKLDEAAEQRRIAAPDYRKLLKMSTESLAQPDPYGSGKTLGQAMQVTDADLAINAKLSELVVKGPVMDKSMLNSGLNAMDEEYNTKTIYKDTLAMVQSVQKSGVIVKSHDVQTHHTALGSYDIHTLELKPINGQPSIIRAKVPKVDDEGYFIAAGNKYLMRKQIVD